MIWREKRIVLIVLGVLLAANLFFFLTYRVQYQSRLDDIDTRVESLQQQLEQARLARIRTEKQRQSYQQVERDIDRVFNELWSTQPKRFTIFLGEVKRLAAASNLAPQAYSFSRATSEANQGRQRLEIGAVDVETTFSVTGTYQQVRRLINLLELSQQFVIINGITLNAPDQDTLTLNLHLKTLFREEPQKNAGNRL